MLRPASPNLLFQWQSRAITEYAPINRARGARTPRSVSRDGRGSCLAISKRVAESFTELDIAVKRPRTTAIARTNNDGNEFGGGPLPNM